MNGFDSADELLALEAVADQVGDGAHLQVVFLTEEFELGPAHHLSVFADDFAADADGFETGESAEIDDGFGVTGADEDTAGFGAEGDHVAGAGEILGLGVGIDEDLNGGGAVEGADAGGGAVEGIDHLGHGGAVAGGVQLGHHGDLELGEAFFAGGDERYAAAELDHEVDGGGGAFVGGDDEIAFVFSVFIIDDDDHSSVLQFFENVGDGAEWHSPIVSRRGRIYLWLCFGGFDWRRWLLRGFGWFLQVRGGLIFPERC